MTTEPVIRCERCGDETAIRALVTRAFEEAEHKSGTEAEIVDGLRAAEALSLSLVAEAGARLVGHVAFSPVTIGDEAGWFGLGPLAVLPEARRRGVGARLVSEGLARLRRLGAKGCVLVGEPAYYGRFGFASRPGLSCPGVPAEFLLCLAFGRAAPAGPVTYHQAFEPA